MTKRTDGPSAAVKLRVMKRDRFTCVYCGVSGKEAELEIDHVHPVSKGGSHHIGNLVTACRRCNQKKSDGTMPRSVAANSTGTPEKPAAGLEGMYLVTLKEQASEFGLVQYQGRIVTVDGDTCLVQRFSFMDGRPTDVIPIPKSTIYDQSKCRLFSQWEEWRRFMFNDAEDARRKRGDPVGWHGGDFEKVVNLERMLDEPWTIRR